jgi:hypothetical protein
MAECAAGLLICFHGAEKLYKTSMCAVIEAKRREPEMLWTIFVILLVLWLVGVVSSYTLGGFIHILLLLALVTLVLNLVSGRRSAV